MNSFWRAIRISLGTKINARIGVLVLAIFAGLAILSGCGSSSQSSRLVYVAGGQNIYAYRIKSTGAATAIVGSPFLAGVSPSSIVVHPSGKFAYVTTLTPSNVAALVHF